MRNDLAQKICDAISVPDALRFYGYENGRNNRIPCPIHKGRGYNFGYNKKVFHCFTCGAKGNVITLAMELFDLSFIQAVQKLAIDFGIKVDRVVSKHERAKLRQAEKDRKIQQQILADIRAERAEMQDRKIELRRDLFMRYGWNHPKIQPVIDRLDMEIDLIEEFL